MAASLVSSFPATAPPDVPEHLRPTALFYGPVSRIYAEGFANRPNLGDPPIYRFLLEGRFKVVGLPILSSPNPRRRAVFEYPFGEVFLDSEGQHLRVGLSQSRILPPPGFKVFQNSPPSD